MEYDKLVLAQVIDDVFVVKDRLERRFPIKIKFNIGEYRCDLYVKIGSTHLAHIEFSRSVWNVYTSKDIQKVYVFKPGMWIDQLHTVANQIRLEKELESKENFSNVDDTSIWQKYFAKGDLMSKDTSKTVYKKHVSERKIAVVNTMYDILRRYFSAFSTYRTPEHSEKDEI